MMALVLDGAAEHADVNGRHTEAIALYSRAVEIAEKLGDVSLIVQTLRNLATCHEHIRDWEAADHCFRRALKATDPADEEAYHITLAYLAAMYLDGQQDVEQAEPLYRQLLEFWVARDDHEEGNDAVMRRCLGTCAMNRGQWVEAEELFRMSIPTFKRLGHTLREGDAWRDLSTSLCAQGRNEEAHLATCEWQRLKPPGQNT